MITIQANTNANLLEIIRRCNIQNKKYKDIGNLMIEIYGENLKGIQDLITMNNFGKIVN